MNGNPTDALPIPTSVAPVGAVDVDYDAVERIGPVGSGSNATVFEARAGDHRVALKEPSVEDDRVAERFVDEAEVWSRLADHDHVVGVVDWGTGDEAQGTDGPWLALEFADGGDLRSRERPGVAEALWVARCLADAVAGAHEQGVVHLDLTPDNVLFRSVDDSWDVPKVGDWGLARRLDDATDPDGVTPPYAAPEQFENDGGDALDERTDVYQLGALLYRLLTGEAPYSGPPSEIEAAVLAGDPPCPTVVDPGLPAAVDEVVARATANDPADRYDTAEAFRADLDDVLVAVVERASTAGDGPTGTDAALERQGFERVTAGYFEDREPAPPSEAWRAGLDLVDVDAGYAVERTVERDGERVSLSARLRERLDDGGTVAVVGPPGAGKSTVCKQVACAWRDAGTGPVLYRESGQGRRLDAPATLRRYLAESEDTALVVVEDAVRGEASAVFDAVAAVAGDPSVSVLLDARRDEWEAADVALDRERERVRQRAVAVESVSPPDRTEYERFVAAVERSAGTDLDVAVEELVPEVREAAAGEQRQPGELFLLLHRLLAHLDLDGTDGADAATTLDEAVQATKLALERRGETFLDVGVAANLLNAAGVGVSPELLHAVAPDDETAVAEAIDVLDGRVLFTGDGAGPRDGPYRAVHEVWSAEFLATLLDAEGAETAHERFDRVVSRVLALADDAERREEVAWALRGETEYLERIAESPGEWTDAVVGDAFELGTEWPKLAALYGTAGESALTLPDACSEAVAVRRFEWRGDAYRNGDDYDRSEREYRRLLDELRGEDPTVDDEALLARARLKLGHVYRGRDEYDRAIDHTDDALALARSAGARITEADCLRALGGIALVRDEHERGVEYYEESVSIARDLGDRRREALARRKLGEVAQFRGETDRAREWYEESLATMRDIGDRGRVGVVLSNLGNLATKRGATDEARSYHHQCLEIAREIGSTKREADALGNLGNVAYEEGRFDRSREYHRRSLDLKRAIGDRRGVSKTLNDLGIVADRLGEYDRARDRYRESLEIKRDIGDRSGEAGTLLNLGVVARLVGDLDEARDRYRESLETMRELGHRRGEAQCLQNLGTVTRYQGDHERAREYHEASLEVAREIGLTRTEAANLANIGTTARLRGRYDRAREYYEESVAIARDVGNRAREASVRTELGLTSLRTGDHDEARDHLEPARETAREVGQATTECTSLYGLGKLARREGEFRLARRRLTRALAVVSDEAGTDDVAARVRLELARTALESGDPEEAEAHLRRARDSFARLGITHRLARCRILAGRIAVAAGNTDEAREQWRTVLETVDEAWFLRDATTALRYLVETCRNVGDEERARAWYERARETLADAPEPVADTHRAWVDDHDDLSGA